MKAVINTKRGEQNKKSICNNFISGIAVFVVSRSICHNTYIVLRKDTPPDSPARKMAEFMLTEDGQLCVEPAGYGKLK